MFKKINIGVLGIGYVGLPLSLCFARKYKLIAYDANIDRINELKINIDRNNEFKKKDFIKVKNNLYFTSKADDLSKCNIFIITVPTPINANKKPDLKFLNKANKIVGKYITNKNIVVYESTVYPGLTEEHCVPMLEKISKLKFKNINNFNKLKNNYFYCGYSPERINPGDNKHTIENIPKIVAGSTPAITNFLYSIYSKVIKAKIFKVESIRVAEAAKVIENTQRDLNIALINEFSLIFNRMSLDTNKILDAASTKWNFLNFKPGLVGGHCISVDPYYLTYKSKKVGYNPKLILAGREINDNMGKYIADISITHIKNKKTSRILILGLTFKENCSDLRNSQVYNIFKNLKNKTIVDIYDPLASSEEIKRKYKKNNQNKLNKKYYDLIIVAVAHNFFKKMGIKKISNLLKDSKSKNIIDIKGIFEKKDTLFRL